MLAILLVQTLALLCTVDEYICFQQFYVKYGFTIPLFNYIVIFFNSNFISICRDELECYKFANTYKKQFKLWLTEFSVIGNWCKGHRICDLDSCSV